MMSRLLRIAGVCLTALTMGCAGASIRTFSKPTTGQRQYGKIKKVAVLPFDSVVEGAQAPRIAGEFFIQELLSRETFDSVEEPRYVNELMKKLKLRNTEGLDKEVVRKLGEELQAQALILGDLLLYGQEENSEIVEFVLQTNMIDVETGDVLWTGRTFGSASTSAGKIFGINQGPSVNDLAKESIASLVARLDGEIIRARKVEVAQMLEAAKVEEVEEELMLDDGAVDVLAPDVEDAEEILLDIQPK